MPEKIKKNLLGRTVTKTSTTGDYGDVTKKVVRKSNGDFVRSRLKNTSSAMDGTRTLKRTENKNQIKDKIKYDYPAGKSDVVKRKISKSTAGTSVTKETRSGAAGKTRSVTTRKPGQESTKTNMGPVKQARVFRREIKKNK